MNQPNEQYIKAQEFRRWLLKQPDDRTWDYSDVYQCVICSFLKETGASTQPLVGGTGYQLRLGWEENSFPIPYWLFDALKVRLLSLDQNTISVSQLKTALNL